MKVEVNEMFKPVLESMVDGVRVKSLSEALNLHLLKTLKPAKSGTKKEPAQQ